MGRIFVRAALMASGALVLGACGLADSRSPVPEFMRAKALEPPPPELPPDVSQIAREKLESLFLASSYPRNVRASPPHREPRGSSWTACVQAEITSATGQPLGTQTYRVTISGGLIVDRRRAEGNDACASETFEPI
jgi:hypothetical protein